jgi:hypothetical protein
MWVFELAFGLISTHVTGDLNLTPATNNEERQSSVSTILQMHNQICCELANSDAEKSVTLPIKSD